MKKHSLVILALLAASTCASLHAQSSKKRISEVNNTLWYNTPAVQWEETLPLGNGRLGMMPDGGVEQERIVLNNIHMWSGSEADYRNPEAASYLPTIQQLLFQGKNKEAQEMMYQHFVPVKPEKGGTYGSYQMLGNLDITYRYPADDGSYKAYKRYLDLEQAFSATHFTKGGVNFIRGYFVPRSKDVMVMRIITPLQTDGHAISFTAKLSRPERATVRAVGDTLIMEGALDSGKEGVDGVRFTAKLFVDATGGKVNVSDQGISVEGASATTLFISSATSLERSDYNEYAGKKLMEAIGVSYGDIKKEHITEYQKLFKRASLFVGKDGDANDSDGPWNLPTDERIRRFVQNDDPSLASLYYNYGRYLLISSTRPGSLPPNLQGLWANECGTPWNGDYHLNINVQMNHWPVEQGNLSELHQPLVALTRGLVQSGEATAKAFYGPHARGWVAHMMTNVWNFTAPGEHPSWGATNTGGAWLCAHLWEHYLFTQNRQYLKEIYPTLKGAAEFFLSTMVKEPVHGWLVTAPSSSPENSFYVGNDPTPVSVCMGPVMDTELIHELYGNVIEAARLLKTDKAFADSLTAALAQLPPLQISKEGYLMEWLEDYRETDVHHRHVSHLYGLHPGNQISPTKTPALAEACRATLNRRGDEGTGWSRAWKINFWARLGDGDRAYKLFRSLLVPAYTLENPKKHGSGTFPNLFCSHPPFQMDGNWGGTSGISEMLVQSHEGFINLLPALPPSWSEGSLQGFKVRGGATVSLTWNDNRVTTATLQADKAYSYQLKKPAGTQAVKVTRGKRTKTFTGEYISLPLAAGEVVSLEFEK
ncbi:MAG: glycoside hydrolase family 95 protein [Bacteroides graminisolvens]|nr:glycoside hydrolase family 95 protein [Bacteroides graminisolvens]